MCLSTSGILSVTYPTPKLPRMISATRTVSHGKAGPPFDDEEAEDRDTVELEEEGADDEGVGTDPSGMLSPAMRARTRNLRYSNFFLPLPKVS